MSDNLGHPEGGAEHAIEHGERIALKFMAAAGLSMTVAAGLIVEAGNMRSAYIHEFASPPAIVEQQEAKSDPPPKDAPPYDPSKDQSHGGGSPFRIDDAQPSGSLFRIDDVHQSAIKHKWSAAAGAHGAEKKSSPPGFFQSVWDLHSKPSLSLDLATGRTMLDDWLVKESDNFEKLELASRAAPWLMNDLDPKEKKAFENILDVYRSHQANAPANLKPVPTLAPPPAGSSDPH